MAGTTGSESGKHNQEAPITKSAHKEWIMALFITICAAYRYIFTLFFYRSFRELGVLYRYANYRSIFFAGMWLMARRKLEHWLGIDGRKHHISAALFLQNSRDV